MLYFSLAWNKKNGVKYNSDLFDSILGAIFTHDICVTFYVPYSDKEGKRIAYFVSIVLANMVPNQHNGV